MEIQINSTDVTPVYEQIIRQISDAVVKKQIKIGALLPSVRQLANDLEVNHNTVAKAYQYLERNGVIVTAGRKGTFVSQSAIHNIDNHAEQTFSIKLLNLLEESKELGLSEKRISELFKIKIKEIKFGGKK